MAKTELGRRYVELRRQYDLDLAQKRLFDNAKPWHERMAELYSSYLSEFGQERFDLDVLAEGLTGQLSIGDAYRLHDRLLLRLCVASGLIPHGDNNGATEQKGLEQTQEDNG